jgi:hypothetical protein
MKYFYLFLVVYNYTGKDKTWTFALREGSSFQRFEKRVLKKTFEPKKDMVREH